MGKELTAIVIAALVPALVAALRVIAPMIPKRWLPVAAPLLGGLVEIVMKLGGLTEIPTGSGALFGLAGVGVREVYDQMRPGKVAVGLLTLILPMTLLTAGCSMRVPLTKAQGPYEHVILDKLEGSDTQVEHDKLMGIQVGSVALGLLNRDIYRVPGATNATLTTTSYMDAQGQVIKTEVQTSIGDLVSKGGEAEGDSVDEEEKPE